MRARCLPCRKLPARIFKLSPIELVIQTMLQCRQFKNEELALGRALNLVRGVEPFRSYKFGNLSNVLMGQIKRGHYLFTLDEERLVGYVGWALCREDVAKAWVENRGVRSFKECDDGDCWVGITFFAATAQVCRFQARACRQLYPGYVAYGIRDYGPRQRSMRTVNRIASAA